MARCTFLCLVLSVPWAGCAGHEHTPPVDSPPAALVLEPAEIDLGEVAINTETTFRACLVNRGSEPVAIEKVGSSCGCAEAKVEPRQLAPGESAEVSGKYRAASHPGPVAQQVIIQPAGGVPLVVRVKGNLFRTLLWSPEAVVLRPSLTADRSDRARLTISNGSESPIQITKGSSDCGDLTCKVEPGPIAPGGQGGVTVTASAKCLRRQIVKMRLETSHPRENPLEVPIEIRPEQCLDVAPEVIHLGVIPKAELLARKEIRVVIRGNAMESLAFRSVESVPYLKSLGEPTPGSQPAEFRFALVDRFPSIDLSGTLSFSFARGKDCVSIEVPVSGFLFQSK